MLPWKEIIRQALLSVRANLLRSILTLLIIAIGITALIGILTAIDSFVYSLGSNFSNLGANSFTIFPKGQALKGNKRGVHQKSGEIITLEEATSFKERTQVNGKVTITVTAAFGATIKHDEEKTNPNIRVRGMDENFFFVNNQNLIAGRDFSEIEYQVGTDKAILGMNVVKTLFDNKAEKALGKEVLINNIKYTVAGVLESKGSSMNSNDDQVVLIPLNNVRRHFSSAEANHKIMVYVNNTTDLPAAVSQSTGLFRAIRKLHLSEDDDFEVFTSDSLVDMINENTKNLRLGTVVVGLMTLLGAAIGLMNIMLVSVTERTREIGIRKSLGATKHSILAQFLAESILICQMGGFIGIVLGILIGFGVAKAMGGPFTTPWLWVVGGVVMCFIVGLASGLYPATKAANLDPIESLRYE